MNKSYVVDMGWDRILKDHSKIKGCSVEIGLFGEGATPADNVAYRGFINEYGIEIVITEKMRGYLHVIGLHVKATTDKVVIPSRPFMRETFEKNETKIFELIDEWYTKLVEGTIDLHGFFTRIGVLVEGLTKISIRSGEWTKNHPITIENKGSSKPLIDSGEMLNSVKFEIYYGSIINNILNEGL